MPSDTKERGSGSAIIGVRQFATASLVSAGVGLLHNGTALPMTGAILVCVAAAGLVWLARARSGQ